MRCLPAVLLFLFASALNAGAQTIDGDWQGTLSAGPVELKVILHLAADGQGGLKASLDSPDQGAKNIAVASARFADSTLTFQVPPIGGSYTGKADASLETITGSWSQGGMSAPLTFTRFVATAAKPRVSKPSDIDGDWDGTVTLPGANLRIVLHIATFEDGMTATLDSPDQGAFALPAASITRTGTKLQFVMKQIGGEFSGTLDAGLTAIDGTFTQLGNSMPLVLKRRSR